MLDQLRIQCPSCGIILDVRNSKHEALKQIVCPNCKKQLAVNFEEESEPLAPPQPIEPLYYCEMRIDLHEGVNKIALPDSDKVEIKVVRLKDGNSKCIVRPLSDAIPVKVKSQQLQADEQVVLAKGDYLEIGKTCLRAGEPGTITPPINDGSDGEGPECPPKPNPQIERNFIWLYAALAFVVLMGATILLWPNDSAKPKPQVKIAPVIDKVGNADSTDKKVTNRDDGKGRGGAISKVENADSSTPLDYSKMSDFDLEKKALKGDVEAQFVLGNRLAHRTGPSNIIRGLKYLKMAAQHGSAKASVKLNQAVNALRERAEDGDSISYYILKSI